MKITIPTDLNDGALAAEVTRLAGSEREATVRLIVHLAEFDRRRLYLGLGYSSLYAYCRAVLQFSEPEAYVRMKAARTIRRFPRILEMLLDGSLNLTTLRLLIPHLKGFNHVALLSGAAGKSKREVAELIARLFPQPDVASSVRKLPAAWPTTDISVPLALARLGATDGASQVMVPATVGCDTLMGRAVLPPAVSVGPSPPITPAVPAPHCPVVTPLSADRYKITITVSTETRDKLDCARYMLRHAVTNGDAAAIIDRALTALLHELARKKFADTPSPRRTHGKVHHSRYIPAAVKRVVWVRDCGRCAFVAGNGHRCAERGFVQFHHLIRHADGGPATAANLALRCAAHNRYEEDLHTTYPPGRVTEAASLFGALRVDRSTGSGVSCV